MLRITTNIKAASLILMLLSLVPSAAMALGLGGIQLDSTLEQPLKAKIKILGAKDQDLQGMDIKLASDAVYKRMGIQPNSNLENIQFSASKNEDGNFFIDVSTPNIISEPFVNFLIEVNWKAGRLLREFTVLLDPPVFLEEKSPAVETPEAELSPTFTVTTDESNESEPVVSAPVEDSLSPAEEALLSGAEEPSSPALVADLEEDEPEKTSSLVYKEVKKNEYLWNIAESMRPEDVTVEQMMLALQRENPHAFYGGTVSQLKAGVVLRIDDTKVLHETSVEEAIAEIARQHQEWLAINKARQAQNAVAAESTNVELEGSAEPAQVLESIAKTTDEPRLELVTPVEELDEEKRAQTNVSLQAANERLNQLTVELALANETVEAAKQENLDLLNRLGSIEEQMSAMQSLIQLKDAEIQRMQGEDVTIPTESSSVLSLDLGKESMLDKNVVTQKEVHPRGVEDAIWRLLQDPVTIASIIFAVLFIALIVWVATRKAAVSDEDSLELEQKPAYTEKTIDELFPEDNESELRKKITERTELLDVEGDKGLEPLTEFSLDNTEILESSDELLDYIAQADVYLSYEKFEKAETLLLEAIEKEPENQKYKLKLLEVYTLKKDIDAFNNQADILFAAIEGDTTNPLWMGACVLAEQIGSDNPLFNISHTDSLTTDEPKETASVSMPKVDEWEPDQVTEVVETLDAEPETEFEIDGTPAVTTEAVAEEEPSSEIEIDTAVKTEDSAVISDSELESAMASFTDDALNQEARTDMQQDTAVTEMLNSLQTSNPDKIFDEDNVLDDNSLFLLSDEIGTKLDLAKAYIEMGDQDGARDLLNEVIDEGNSSQKVEAKELLELT